MYDIDICITFNNYLNTLLHNKNFEFLRETINSHNKVYAFIQEQFIIHSDDALHQEILY